MMCRALASSAAVRLAGIGLTCAPGSHAGAAPHVYCPRGASAPLPCDVDAVGVDADGAENPLRATRCACKSGYAGGPLLVALGWHDGTPSRQPACVAVYWLALFWTGLALACVLFAWRVRVATRRVQVDRAKVAVRKESFDRMQAGDQLIRFIDTESSEQMLVRKSVMVRQAKEVESLRTQLEEAKEAAPRERKTGAARKKKKGNGKQVMAEKETAFRRKPKKEKKKKTGGFSLFGKKKKKKDNDELHVQVDGNGTVVGIKTKPNTILSRPSFENMNL